MPHRSYKNTTTASPGSTATIALIRDGYELVIAQLGDSGAFLCRSTDDANDVELGGQNRRYKRVGHHNNENDGGVGKNKCKRLTMDHCASNPIEKQRIVEAGGE